MQSEFLITFLPFVGVGISLSVGLLIHRSSPLNIIAIICFLQAAILFATQIESTIICGSWVETLMANSLLVEGTKMSQILGIPFSLTRAEVSGVLYTSNYLIL
jgi:hypothetical protein